MAKRFLTPINVLNAASDPVSAVEGDIYYNTTTDKLRIYSNSAWSDVSSGGGVTSLSGTANQIDVSASTGSVTLSLSNTAVTPATYGSASAVGAVTVDSKGRITTASNTPIAIAQSAVTNLTTDLSAKAPLASPTFTGTVTVPTPVNSTDAATKAYVDSVVINTQTSSYTLALADAGEVVEMNVGSANTLTVPANDSIAFPIGTSIDIVQYGAGQTTIIAGSTTSPDTTNTGTTWTTVTSNFGTTTIRSIAYGNGLWIAGGFSGQIRTSTNGSTWTTVTSNFGTSDIRSISYGNNLWVAVGVSGQMRTSTNGSTWTTVTSNFGTTNIFTVGYGNGIWVAAGEWSELRTSTDAITWTTRASNFPVTPSGHINSVSYGSGLWVIVGRGGNLANSTDAITWTTQNSNFGTTVIQSVSYGNGLWIAGGYTGQMRTSTNGSTWTTVTSNFGTTNINSIAYANGLWIAGGDGQMRTSTNGSTWTTVTSNFGASGIRSTSYGNNLWIAVGDSGTIRTSIQQYIPVTIRSSGNKLKLTSQYSAATLYKRGTDEWVAMGDLTA